MSGRPSSIVYRLVVVELGRDVVFFTVDVVENPTAFSEPSRVLLLICASAISTVVHRGLVKAPGRLGACLLFYVASRSLLAVTLMNPGGTTVLGPCCLFAITLVFILDLDPLQLHKRRIHRSIF